MGQTQVSGKSGQYSPPVEFGAGIWRVADGVMAGLPSLVVFSVRRLPGPVARVRAGERESAFLPPRRPGGGVGLAGGEAVLLQHIACCNPYVGQCLDGQCLALSVALHVGVALRRGFPVDFDYP